MYYLYISYREPQPSRYKGDTLPIELFQHDVSLLTFSPRKCWNRTSVFCLGSSFTRPCYDNSRSKGLSHVFSIALEPSVERIISSLLPPISPFMNQFSSRSTRTRTWMQGTDPSALPLSYWPNWAISSWTSGDDENRTHHRILAKDSRRLGNMHPQNFKIRFYSAKIECL